MDPDKPRLCHPVTHRGCQLRRDFIILHRLTVDNWMKNMYKGEENIIIRDGFRKNTRCYRFIFHMKTFREKLTFVLTALAYIVFHIRTGQDLATIASGTFLQMMTTLPYAVGFTYVLIVILRHLTGTTPPWDRIFRIFFTIGILFAFFFALYEYGDRAEKMRKQQQEKPVTVSRIWQNENQKVRLYWA